MDNEIYHDMSEESKKQDREQAIYRWEYYGVNYPFDDGRDIISIEDQGGGYAIQAALDSIVVVRDDDDTFHIKVGDKTYDPIDDIYLTDVTRRLTDDGDGDKVVFHRSNNAESLEIPIDVFEDPIIDLETF